jgi:hypothetical protein
MRTPDVHEVPSISCKHEQIQFFHTLKDTQKKKKSFKEPRTNTHMHTNIYLSHTFWILTQVYHIQTSENQRQEKLDKYCILFLVINHGKHLIATSLKCWKKTKKILEWNCILWMFWDVTVTVVSSLVAADRFWCFLTMISS